VFNRVRHRGAESPEYRYWIQSSVDTHVGDPVFCGVHPQVRSDSPFETIFPADIVDSYISDNSVRTRKGHRVRVKSNIPRPCKPVDHSQVRIVSAKDDTYIERSITVGASCPVETTISEQVNPAAWLCARYGYDWVVSLLKANTPTTTAGYTFSRPDWFSIVSEFNELVDSLIPQSFFLGESLYESSIFGEAISLVVSPKRTIRHLIKDVLDRGLHRKNLGEINRHYHKDLPRSFLESGDIDAIRSFSKDAVNASLLYKFGIRPAISDIIDTVSAHSNVEKKLRYLSDNAGQYVPLRIRKKLHTSFDSSTPTTPFVELVRRQTAQHSIATMFAQGRVRTDINDLSKWRVYAEYFGLNKIVGTAWELIPFSFVIDWFTNAQERINDLTRIRLGESPFYNLVGVGSSIKDILTFEFVITPGYDSVFGVNLVAPTDPFVAFTANVSNYTRIPGLPDTSGVVDVSTLGLFHGITGLELLLQRVL
jgi:hypothetical protein